MFTSHKFLRMLATTALVALPLALGPVTSFAQDVDGLATFVASSKPPTFDTSAATIEAFKKAVTDNDFDGLAKLLGLDPAKL
ncbi:DUF2950 domain-containing protein, partial [Rhizobiaceae sp. 2RAB30]